MSEGDVIPRAEDQLLTPELLLIVGQRYAKLLDVNALRVRVG